MPSPARPGSIWMLLAPLAAACSLVSEEPAEFPADPVGGGGPGEGEGDEGEGQPGGGGGAGGGGGGSGEGEGEEGEGEEGEGPPGEGEGEEGEGPPAEGEGEEGEGPPGEGEGEEGEGPPGEGEGEGPPPGNLPPAIEELTVPAAAAVGDVVPVRVLARDPDGDPLFYRWEAAGGVFAAPDAAETTWSARPVGSVVVGVTVWDPRGAAVRAETAVTVSARAGCTDRDGDGYGRGVGCLPGGEDCADRDPTSYPGAPEVCDRRNNDCDDEVDEADPPPQLPEHCGRCFNACAFAHAVPLCADSRCALGGCLDGWYDMDQRSDNGCEYRCVGRAGSPEECNDLDDDCDRLVDEDACPDDRFSFCADIADAGGVVVCEDFAAGALAPLRKRPFAEGSLVDGGALVPALSAGWYAAPPGPQGDSGGHTTTFLGYDLAAFSLSFRVRFHGGPVAVGIFADDARDAGHGGAGYGYVVEVLAVADEPRIAVRRLPDGEPLALVPDSVDPDLFGGGRRRVEVRRDAGGAWAVAVDGREQALSVRVPDLTTVNFTKLSVHARRGVVGAPASALDDVLLLADPDADGVYAPLDGCPGVSDPDQADPDGDGRGIACDDRDGDGVEDGEDACPVVPDPAQADADADGLGDACETDGLVLLLRDDAAGRAELALLDVGAGVRRRGVALPAGARELAVSSRGNRATWAGADGEVYAAAFPPLDPPVLLAPAGADPAWISGGRVLFHGRDHEAVWVVSGDGGEDPEPAFDVPGGQQARAWPSRDGQRVAVVRRSGAGGTVELLTSGFEPVFAAVRAPLPDAGFPEAQPHPTDDAVLLAGTTGGVAGVFVLGADGALATLSNRPAVAAVWTPDGAAVVALEPVPGTDARRVVGFPAAGGDPWVLVPPSLDLPAGALGWARPPEPPPWADADDDGLDDATDPCPAVRGGFAGAGEVRATEAADGAFGPSLAFAGDAWALGWVERRRPQAAIIHVSRLDLSGRVAASHGPSGYLEVSSDTLQAAAAWSGHDAYAAWKHADDGRTAVVRMSAALSVRAGPTTVVRDLGGGARPALAVAGAALMLVGGNVGVRMLNRDLAPTGLLYTPWETANAHAPSAAWTGAGFGLAYHGDACCPNWNVGVRLLSPGGEPTAGTRWAGRDRHQTWPSLAWSGREFGLAFVSDVDGQPEVWFLRLAADGTPLMGEVRVSAQGGATAGVPSIAWDGDGWGVAWTGGPPSAVWFARLSAAGERLTPEVRVSSVAALGNWASLVWTGAEYGLAWEDWRAGAFPQVWFHHGRFECP